MQHRLTPLKPPFWFVKCVRKRGDLGCLLENGPFLQYKLFPGKTSLFFLRFFTLLLLLPSLLMSRLISHVQWVDVFVVAAVGELVWFSLWLLCREAAQRIMGPEAANISKACGLYHYQKHLRQDVSVFLQRCVEVIYFTSFIFFYLEQKGEIQVLLLLRSLILFRSIWGICQADFFKDLTWVCSILSPSKQLPGSVQIKQNPSLNPSEVQ